MFKNDWDLVGLKLENNLREYVYSLYLSMCIFMPKNIEGNKKKIADFHIQVKKKNNYYVYLEQIFSGFS